MEKKEVSVNTVVKSIITGFASYGIIFYIIVVLSLVVASRMTSGVGSLQSGGIRIVLSVVLALFCYILVRFTCRVSTMDVFKKCVMNPESYSRVGKKMSLFYVICIVLCMFTGLMLLNLNLKYARAEIAYYKVFNSQTFSEDYVEMQEQEMNKKYNADKDAMVKSTVIVEIGLVLGFLSLINYQGKMLGRYNEYSKVLKSEETPIEENAVPVEEATTTVEENVAPVEVAGAESVQAAVPEENVVAAEEGTLTPEEVKEENDSINNNDNDNPENLGDGTEGGNNE